jgi:tetratricopeptide (TPR) repeat protein
MIRFVLSLTSMAGLLLLGSCGTSVETTPRTFPGQSDDVAAGLESFYENRVEDAIPYFKRAVDTKPKDADARAWLAEAYWRTEWFEEAHAQAERALELDSCHSFALTVLGNLYNPQYPGDKKLFNELMAWDMYERAVECDPLDGNAWIPLWVMAMKREQVSVVASALTAMHETGFWPPSLMAHDRWMLEDVPENAILLVNGDADTFPTLILQAAQDMRRDVAVINVSLLNLQWYGRLMAQIHRLPFPEDIQEPHMGSDGEPVFVSTQVLRHWLAMADSGELGRPVAIALTVDPERFEELSFENRKLMGGYFLYSNDASGSVDVDSVRRSLERLTVADFAGPYASQWDRSPVRHANSKNLAYNPMAVALRCSHMAMEGGDRGLASEMLTWAEQYHDQVDLGGRFDEQLQALQEAVAGPSGD